MALAGRMERPIFVDMESKLLEDKGGVYRKELINKLLQHETEINVMIHDANDDTALFNRLNRLKTATAKAKETVEKF
ncbi:MAG: hypothetical protein LBT64_01675 [Puniceicoccales bacterium]|jgi:hypothetical protein|nr:hypothetical protein [Puniceicoccales bacterium]